MQLSVDEWEAIVQTARILKVAYEPTEKTSPNEEPQSGTPAGHRLAHAVVIAARLILHEVEAALARARSEQGGELPENKLLEIEGLQPDDLAGLMTLFLENSQDISRRVSADDLLGTESEGEYRAAHLRNEIVMRSLEHLQEQLDNIVKRLGRGASSS